MPETGSASDWLARYAELDSDVCFRMNFHKNAIYAYTGINNALHCAIKEKEKMLRERNVSRTARLQLTAAKDELTKRNEEQAAEIQSLKRKLQEARKASDTPGLQGSVCEHNQSGVHKRSTHKGKQEDGGHAGEDAEVTEDLSDMNNLGQGLSTELGDVKEEIRNINAKPTKLTYRRKARAEGAKDSAVKVRRSSRLVAMEDMATKATRAKAAKLDVGEASRTLQDDAGSSTATPAALHAIGQECGLSPDELEAAMLLSSMYRCSPSLPWSTSL